MFPPKVVPPNDEAAVASAAVTATTVPLSSKRTGMPLGKVPFAGNTTL